MLSLDRVLGAVVLVKAVDVVLRGPQALPTATWVVVLGLWVAGGLALVAGVAGRTPWSIVLAGGVGLAVDLPLELRRQHLVLLLAVAIVSVVSREERERLLLLRVQLSALYGVAALAKLNEPFLGGTVLAQATADAPAGWELLPLPLLVAAGVGLIAVEAALAVTPWVARLRLPGTALAAGLHALALLVVGGGPLVTLRLLVFGGTAVALHAASAGLLPATAPAGVRPPASPVGSGR